MMRLSRRQAVSGVAAALVMTGHPAVLRASNHSSGPYRAYAPGPYGQVHFRDGGSGTPLILCHQAPMSHRQFDLVFDRLMAAGLRPIAIDMPGFGMSDPTDFVPTITDYAKVVPAVLDHLGLTQVDILGHHTGALVATEVAINYPDRVNRLILNGPLPLGDEQRAMGLDYVERVEKGFVSEPDGSHLSMFYGNRMMYANEATDWDLANRYIAEKFIGLAPFWYGHHAAFQYDHAETLPKITQPTLVLTNTGDEIYPNALQTKEIRPDFEYAEIEGGSIDIMDEKPEEWTAAVVRYLMAKR